MCSVSRTVSNAPASIFEYFPSLKYFFKEEPDGKPLHLTFREAMEQFSHSDAFKISCYHPLKLACHRFIQLRDYEAKIKSAEFSAKYCKIVATIARVAYLAGAILFVSAAVGVVSVSLPFALAALITPVLVSLLCNKLAQKSLDKATSLRPFLEEQKVGIDRARIAFSEIQEELSRHVYEHEILRIVWGRVNQRCGYINDQDELDALLDCCKTEHFLRDRNVNIIASHLTIVTTPIGLKDHTDLKEFIKLVNMDNESLRGYVHKPPLRTYRHLNADEVTDEENKEFQEQLLSGQRPGEVKFLELIEKQAITVIQAKTIASCKGIMEGVLVQEEGPEAFHGAILSQIQQALTDSQRQINTLITNNS